MEVILASKSPRRLQLLQAAGLAVEVRPSHIDESALPGESVPEMVARLCREKAAACPVGNHPVIAADTLVSLHGEPLGQPADMAAAKAMLTRLSAQRHTVLTAVCVRLGERYLASRVETKVQFRELNEAELDIYLAHNEVLDKAGAYAIQAGAASFISAVDGLLDNVIGLPVQETLRLLKEIQS